jgi:succinate dehydrogenase/fumarate reductase cytochrome b subunit
MMATGIPMALRHSRQRLDAFRVVQLATGAYVTVFICSHVTAVLNGRQLGIETDWFFASGPASLLDGTSLLGRLIPHYLFGTLSLIVHVGCGLRIVLLQHGIDPVSSNRALYGVASVGMAITIVIMMALLGFHVEAPG